MGGSIVKDHHEEHVEEQRQELNELMAIRRTKLQSLYDAGVNPYGEKFERTHYAQEIIDNFDSLEGQKTVIAGRLMSFRTHGKASFSDLMDASGRIQLYLRVDVLGEEAYGFANQLDIGDIVGVSGTIFRTKRGQISVEVESLKLLSKSLRPLPDKWHGLKDVDLRYRQRYVDLIVNPDVREVFRKRSQIIQCLRDFLNTRGFIEVETPMLHPIAGGANARPFVTHHNALDMDLYMRIAPELYLKRLLVGGLDKVYEVGKNFRNEGISTKHNPEYTSCEIYEAYADAEDMMKLTEDIFAYIAEQVVGSTKIVFQGREIDLTPPWPRKPMLEAIREYAGVDLTGLNDEQARKLAREKGLSVPNNASYGNIVEEFFDEYVEPHLIQPIFITDHPVEVSPLAKRKKDNPNLTDRFEPFIVTWEVANGFTELNDPIDQEGRFRKQMEQREQGDEEAHMMDEDFIRALEYGMPPAGGLGIGIDRMVMLLTDSPSIRDVLLFPHMRPR
ncbi:MAG TPA: lysine--tRNA ligase [Firmicutes bacterium]|jgi:lysyl-tRNA synthetase class 2|nr:lysine--tRNA ligase [Bacillota bacterium]